ncbi:MAG TPA: class I SAM-dependent methyltransferase [Verrucomicrobiae bacterium]|nr:class I SAM-dependent methyltransferase [Verrucomicrobiae bacterium]
MNRVPEPELMLDDAQARAYAEADFESAHSRYPKLFAEMFPNRPATALVLDIGCGPCDVTIRFARANSGYTFHAVDGSAAMLTHGRERIARDADVVKRVRLIEGCIPSAAIPAKNYDVILSSSLLHHLPDPQALWTTVRQYAKRGTLVFVVDLFRPDNRTDAEALTAKYAGGEPDVLRRDFLNSLLAAFTVEEVREQLDATKLSELTVKTISDRHLMIWGSL